jgi:hypothetical protein
MLSGRSLGPLAGGDRVDILAIKYPRVELTLKKKKKLEVMSQLR